MKTIKILTALLAISLMFASCSKDDNQQQELQKIKIDKTKAVKKCKGCLTLTNTYPS